MRTKLLRASACRSDLLDNGIDLGSLARGAVINFVRFNLDYFQCMLGYDAGVREVISLIRRAGDPSGRARIDGRATGATPARSPALRRRHAH